MILTATKDNYFIDKFDLAELLLDKSSEELRFLLGRSSECHILLDDRSVSREHAQISYKNGNWSLENVSALGLRVNKHEVSGPQGLSTGDIIEIGPFLLECFIEKVETLEEEMPSEDSVGEIESIEMEEDLGIDSENRPDLDSESVTETIMEISDSDDEIAESGSNEDLEDAGQLVGEDELLDDLISEIDSSVEGEVEADEGQEGMAHEMEIEEAIDYSDEDVNESSFASDDHGYEDEDEDEDNKTKILESFSKSYFEIFGEYAPYDKYKLELDEVLIGRDPEKCQIVLNDPEVSTVHAIIRREKSLIMIEDQGSSNGTIHNGKRINKASVVNGDEILIGSTTFTFRLTSDFLESEQGRLMPVEENQEIEVEEVVEVGSDFLDDNESTFALPGPSGKGGSIFKDPEKRRKLLIFVAVIVGASIMFDDDSPSRKEKTKKMSAGEAREVKKKVFKNTSKSKVARKKLAPEDLEFVESAYQLAKSLYNKGKYAEALIEFEKIFNIISDYKQSKQLFEFSKEGLSKLEELERKKQEEINRKIRMKKVENLIKKVRKSVEEKNVLLSEALFAQISELDPENFEISQLKMELEAWMKEEARRKIERAQSESERNRQLNSIASGERFFLKESWFLAIGALEKFLLTKNLDEDLIKKAQKMLNESRNSLNSRVGPLRGKAKSLRDGQDLKGAYELYGEVLELYPNDQEASDQRVEIREILNLRSRKVFREALISESLSLFQDAKEKFQEVQQISPTDSEYYKKGTDKLKNYVE